MSVPSSAAASWPGHQPAPVPATGPMAPSVGASRPSSHPMVAAVDGPRFAFWGSAHSPPGAPALFGPPGPSGGGTRANCGVASTLLLPATYSPASCFGSDEAGLQFYSPLRGSGGNVTWNLTLPVDASATQNQSDLYAAAWVAMTLASPDAWMHECLLEVQFYPDHSWVRPLTTTPGSWAAAAVGWKIDPATGVEDTCFYSPLYQSGVSGQYLSLTQGDNLNVTFQGWPGSAGGERVSVEDLTSGNSSGLQIYNATGGYPLDPAYASSIVPNSLSWSSDGQLPVSFGLAIGRGANPTIPSNGSAGGCSPGLPPSAPADPAVPCPSYDPSSWSNDTLVPWNVASPTFFNASARDSPVQVAFTSSVGGSGSLIDRSNSTCTGRVGSSYCTYPWFSYTCAFNTFEFGATDYPAVSVDFGQSLQYATNPVESAGLMPYFPPTNFSTPGCGTGVGVTVTFNASSGSVEFLSHLYGSTPVGLQHVPPGSYSLSYHPASGSTFSGWQTSGSVSVTDRTSPSTTLVVVGTGAVYPILRAGAVFRSFQYVGGTPGGAVEIAPSLPTNSTAPVYLTSGNSTLLTPDSYTVQALPPLGTCFASWKTSGPSDALASPTLPETQLTFPAGAPTFVLTASYVACAGLVNVELGTHGNGTVTLNGSSTTYNATTRNGTADISVVAGAYALTATPARTWQFAQWTYGPSAMLTNFTNTTWVTLEPGAATLTATFAATIVLVDNPANGGGISLNESSVYDNGTVVLLPPGVYSFDAVPSGGYSFLRWRSNDALHLWVLRPRSLVTLVQVNASATLTATFVTKVNNTVQFNVVPAGAGEIRFNVQDLYTTLTINSSVANGSYLLSVFETYGYRFVGFAASGPVSVGGGFLSVTGTGGTLTAKFVLRLFPVTFIALPPSALGAKINGTSLLSGGTAHLALGTYSLNATLSAGSTWVGWVTGFTLGGAGAGALNTTVQIVGSGSIEGLAVNFQAPSVAASPAAVDVGYLMHVIAFANGTGPLHYKYSGLPTGCSTRSVPSLPCTPSAAGNFSVTVLVTDATGNSLRSTPVKIAVVPAPAIRSFVASSPDFTLGSSTSLTIVGGGGVGTLSYAFLNLPVGCTTSDAPSLVCAPTQTGTFTVEGELSDGLGVSSFANLSFTAEPAPTITSFTATPSTVTVGINATFVTLVGVPSGVWSYAYAGLPAGCGTPSTAAFACAPSQAGAFQVNVTATDHLNAKATASVVLQVNALPAISSFSASPASVVLGASVQFSATAVGGTGPLTFDYSGLPAGCSSVNGTSLNCTPTAVGSFTVTLHAHDQFGRATASSLTLTVTMQSTSPTSPSGSSNNDTLYLIIALLIALAIVAEVVILLRRQARKKT
ncbi:MAG: hypothetical protein L3K19_02725 [Thermoplasmata archaeon]|nr:hypothetical protein [Thermoplasmata archaeon]